jgi:hypothetical protein
MIFTPRLRALPGQTMVEFSLAVSIFLLACLGIFDGTRAVFQAHNLSRASEQMATDLVTQFSFAGTSGITATELLTSTSVLNPATPLQDGVKVGSGAFTSAWIGTESLYSVPVGCAGAACTGEEMDNGADTPYPGSPHTPSIYVCGVPNLESPNYLQVTLRGQFTPVSSYFLGGKTIYTTESATVLTPLGEEAGSTITGSSSCLP